MKLMFVFTLFVRYKSWIYLSLLFVAIFSNVCPTKEQIFLKPHQNWTKRKRSSRGLERLLMVSFSLVTCTSVEVRFSFDVEYLLI